MQTQETNVNMKVPNVQLPQEHTQFDHSGHQQAQSSNDNQGSNVDIPMGEATADINVTNQS